MMLMTLLVAVWLYCLYWMMMGTCGSAAVAHNKEKKRKRKRKKNKDYSRSKISRIKTPK